MADNPFKLHEVKDINGAGDFAGWLASKNDDPVAIAFKPKARKLAVSTIDDAWAIDLKLAPLAGLVLANSLALGRVPFVLRNAAVDLAELATWVSGQSGNDVDFVFRQFEDSLVGDLHSAAYCINQVVTPHTKFQRVEQDAYEIALTLGHYEHNIISYYKAVGIPMAILSAESKARLSKGKTADWWVSYPDLWVRVLAFFTGDPTVAWALMQEDDVFTIIGKVFDQDRDYGHMVLAWAACGMELVTFKSRFVTDILPDDLVAFTKEIEQHMPNLVLGINATKHDYLSRKQALTRYNRRLRPGQDAGEAVAHAVFGTVDDIVAIATVAFWTNRPDRDTMITDISGGPAAESIRISGCGPEPMRRPQWGQTLRELAMLENPLLEIRLQPSIVFP